MSSAEPRQAILAAGPEDMVSWPNRDAAWRLTLVKSPDILTRQLWRAGIIEIFTDGSFAEDKDHPNDINGYFVCALDRISSVSLTRDLNRLDPDKVWTWDPASRKPFRGYPKKQLAMWHRYRVELYPPVPGLGRGVRDRQGCELEFIRVPSVEA